TTPTVDDDRDADDRSFDNAPYDNAPYDDASYDDAPYDDGWSPAPTRRGPRGIGSHASSGAGGRVPPHNIDAEESLLGAMLLSRSAIDIVSETMQPAFFYRPVHAHIYEAIMSLSAQGEAVDPVTVADELRRHGFLEAVGGTDALLSLQAATPATSSAGRYATIIEELALLRSTIGGGGESVAAGVVQPVAVTRVDVE